MKNNFNVGIIGIGKTGSEHLNFFKKNKNIQKIFISEKKINKIKIISKKFFLDKDLKNFNKLSSKNLLVVSNYDYDHFKYLKPNILKNHIFVEKPLCYNFKELNFIKNAVFKNKFNNLVYSNLVLRSSPILNVIKKKILKGEFGKIFYFEGDYIYGRLNKLRNGWRGDKNFYSPILGGGIHMIDLMLFFFGEIPIEVQTFSNKIVTKKDKFKFNDFFKSVFKFKNSSIAKITTNYGGVHNHQHVIKIYGTKKTFIYDDQGPRIFNSRDPNLGIKMKINKLYNSKTALLPDVINFIKNKKNYKNEILKELNLMSVVLSSVKSSVKNKKVKIKEISK